MIFSRESLARRKSEISGLDVERAYFGARLVPGGRDFRGFDARQETGDASTRTTRRYATRSLRTPMSRSPTMSVPYLPRLIFRSWKFLVTDLGGLHSRLQDRTANGTAPSAKPEQFVGSGNTEDGAGGSADAKGGVTIDTERALQVAARIKA